MTWKPKIYAFLDYRAYLAAYYDAAKANTRAFSYRYFSRKAGFSSPNFLKLVIIGQRNLSAESVERFSHALGHDEEETRFFADLVAFDQASDDEERNDAFERLSASRTFRDARRIDAGMFDYLSHWYNPAIREMVGRADFREDPVWIAKRLLPRIRPAEARRSLDLLIDLGLVERGTDGHLRQAEPTLTTGHEVRSLGVANYHRAMLERAGASIETVDRDARDISALTMAIDDRTVAEIKERIHAFRERILDRSTRDERPTRIYQLGIQLFPLTQPLRDD